MVSLAEQKQTAEEAKKELNENKQLNKNVGTHN